MSQYLPASLLGKKKKEKTVCSFSVPHFVFSICLSFSSKNYFSFVFIFQGNSSLSSLNNSDSKIQKISDAESKSLAEVNISLVSAVVRKIA